MAVDYYLKFSSLVEGEVVASGFEKAVQVESWSWGGNQTSSMGVSTGSGAGKVDFSDFSLTTVFDKALPALLKGMAAGTHYDTATFSAIKAGAKNKPYLTIAFNEVFVTSVQLSGAGEVPQVSVSFTFAQYALTYMIQDKEGNMEAGGTASWDLTKNDVKA